MTGDVPLKMKLELKQGKEYEEPTFLMKDIRKERSTKSKDKDKDKDKDKERDKDLSASPGKRTAKFKLQKNVFPTGSFRRKNKESEGLFSQDTWVKLDLEKQAAHDGSEIPYIVVLTIEAIEKRGMDNPELYRLSGRSTVVKQLRTELLSGR